MTVSEKLAFELKNIKPQIMRGDVTDCANSVDRTKATVIKYLKGIVEHDDTGIAILTFFKNKIEERKKQLI